MTRQASKKEEEEEEEENYVVEERERENLNIPVLPSSLYPCSTLRF